MRIQGGRRRGAQRRWNLLPDNARELLLLVLLVKILAAASIASILARSTYFRRLLFRSSKTLQQQLMLDRKSVV